LPAGCQRALFEGFGVGVARQCDGDNDNEFLQGLMTPLHCFQPSCVIVIGQCPAFKSRRAWCEQPSVMPPFPDQVRGAHFAAGRFARSNGVYQAADLKTPAAIKFSIESTCDSR
jgi:hypothetical protein